MRTSFRSVMFKWSAITSSVIPILAPVTVNMSRQTVNGVSEISHEASSPVVCPTAEEVLVSTQPGVRVSTRSKAKIVSTLISSSPNNPLMCDLGHGISTGRWAAPLRFISSIPLWSRARTKTGKDKCIAMLKGDNLGDLRDQTNGGDTAVRLVPPCPPHFDATSLESRDMRPPGSRSSNRVLARTLFRMAWARTAAGATQGASITFLGPSRSK